MATPKVPDLINDWTTLRDNLSSRLEELDFLAPLHARLSELLEEMLRLEAEQEVVLARLHGINERRAEILVLAEEVRRQLGHALRGRFGGKSQTLREFGFKPRTGGPRSKRRAAAEREPEPAP